MNFSFETIGIKNSSAHELLAKNHPIFFSFYGRKWSQVFEPIQTVDVIFEPEK